MARIFAGKRIVLGVTGGIAAYKVVELARGLTVQGATVDVMLTRAAREFVTPLTFQTLTRRPVRTEVIEQWTDADQGHVSLGLNADLIAVAPATAHAIAKIANGLADDMLTVSILASPAPLLIAPAMDHHMFVNQATQENLARLQQRGAIIVGPEEGPLASGLIGKGRLAPVRQIEGMMRSVLGSAGPLAGRKVVVSAGPTREPLDPIRYLSNRSSGKMGYAIAQAAVDAGASTTLITGTTSIDPPVGCLVQEVSSAHEMNLAVQQQVIDADILIMAAAVADYRPVDVAPEKIKKNEGPLVLELERTVDILA
ncbi:MAG TPA: bifunctional phosphopantothenoylcysteine decarboxylase/phosphopantothenate--cysteine ligase CoaBC, partial [Thermomicrobiaceae bacterium]|nr:bifunctional phosphopantothenoylcysteine decarboxylase/phosphopantothenate--cysteine ligase CoaBC [Thermomicrobiaceae bacterium]